jgi:hypothetical protein
VDPWKIALLPALDDFVARVVDTWLVTFHHLEAYDDEVEVGGEQDIFRESSELPWKNIPLVALDGLASYVAEDAP